MSSKSAYEFSALGTDVVSLPPSAKATPATTTTAAPHSPSRPVRAENITRSLFHVASGLVALAMLRLLPERTWLVAVSGSLATWAWSMEFARRRSATVNRVLMRVFSPVAHPHERHQVNSSTWYLTALVGLSLLAPTRAAEVGVVVLAFADPAAGFIGRRFGRTRIRESRSLEGTLAFVVAGALVALATLAIFHAEALSLPAMLLLALAGATAGAIAELVSTRLDDNFTIPVSVAAAVSAASLVLPAV
ncbi:diacylglycerol/polyprenol kinase family protein [Chondromyces apiculatus]|uniref:Putative membrane protein n=1 Tax=Chondromyces apiculatus DSM 436 TaxID=1192034 RepID=A0A017SW69_9BACT|nr:hypothetical protein [Chondromyces apiculatus]EYF00997.1 putative membrane protein [Chondromyces apiculatus DSM 436]